MRVQSCAIALRSPASERRPSVTDIHQIFCAAARSGNTSVQQASWASARCVSFYRAIYLSIYLSIYLRSANRQVSLCCRARSTRALVGSLSLSGGPLWWQAPGTRIADRCRRSSSRWSSPRSSLTATLSTTPRTPT
eukprot:scaffold9919_cov60-Phaeocystis_antarctica.AAC.1